MPWCQFMEPAGLPARAVHGRRWPAQVAVWLAIGGAALFLRGGPLALGISVYLLASSAARLARRALPQVALARLPAAWVLACFEVALAGELLSRLGRLGQARAWVLVFLALDVAASLLARGGSRAGESHLGQEWRAWKRSLRAAPWYLRLFWLLFCALALCNFVLAALSGITVYDSVYAYVPLCISYVQQGSLALPPHYPGLSYFLFAQGWHTVYCYTIAAGNSLAFLNLLGWFSTQFGLLATLLICRQAGLSRALSLSCGMVVFSAPLVVAQAANTNYDQQAGCCMAVTTLLALLAIRRPTAGRIVLLALAQVTLANTKLTAVFVAPTVLLLDLVVVVRCWGARRRRLIPLFVFSGLVAAGAALAPHFVRTRVIRQEWAARGQRARDGGQAAPGPAWSARLEGLGARTVQLLLPYEAGWLHAALGPGLRGSRDVARWLRQNVPAGLAAVGLPAAERFVRHATSHLYYAYNSDTAYFGLLPAVLLCLLLLGARRGGRGCWPARRWILRLSLLGWVGYQVFYGAWTGYTPNHGRYMLLVWFLAAPALGILLTRFSPAGRRAILVAVMFAATVEHFDWVHHRRHMPIDVILNEPRADHFVRIRTPTSNAAQIRALLKQRNVYSVLHDTRRAFQLLYYDARRRRRFRYRPALEYDGTETLFTNLETPQTAPAKIERLRRMYEVRYVAGEINRSQRMRKAFLIPHATPAPARQNLVRVDQSLAGRLELLRVDVPHPTGGLRRDREGRDYVWLGSRYAGGLRLYARAPRAQKVGLLLWNRRGAPALAPSSPCQLELLRDGATLGRFELEGGARLLLELDLHPGTNCLWLFVAAPASTDPGASFLQISDVRLLAAESIAGVLDRGRFRELPLAGRLRAWRSRLLTGFPSDFLAGDESVRDYLRIEGITPGRGMGGIEWYRGGNHLWLGPREAGALRLLLSSTRAARVWLAWTVRKLGVALPDRAACPLTLSHDGAPLARFVCRCPGQYWVQLPLTPGRHRLALSVDADPGPRRYGADRRPTMLYVTGLRLQAAPGFEPDSARQLAQRPAVFLVCSGAAEDEQAAQGPGSARPRQAGARGYAAPLADLAGVDRSLAASLRVRGVAAAESMGGIESFGGTHNVWLGPGEWGQLSVLLEADRAGVVFCALRVLQLGVALADETRCPLEVLVNGRSVVRAEITAPGRYWLRVPLESGSNTLSLRVPEVPDSQRYGLDPRPTMLYLTGLRFQAAIDTGARLAELAGAGGRAWRQTEQTTSQEDNANVH